MIRRICSSLKRNGILVTIKEGANIARYSLSSAILHPVYQKFGGLRYQGVDIPPGNHFQQQHTRQILEGQYESEEIDLIQHLPENTEIIEMGGGAGIFSCIVDEKLIPERHIVVEANEELIPYLEKIRSLNDCDFVIVHGLYTPEPAQGFQRKDDFLGSRIETEPPIGDSPEVRQLAIEDVCREHDVSEGFSLIMDVEGSERFIGDELEFLEENCRFLLVEFHDTKEGFKNTEEIEDARDEISNSAFSLLEQRGAVELYENGNLT